MNSARVIDEKHSLVVLNARKEEGKDEDQAERLNGKFPNLTHYFRIGQLHVVG